MSTKCSLVWGKKFHVYTDCLDNHAFVYIQLDGAEFQASPDFVTIQVPLLIWEYIRTYSPARYNLAHLSDQKLMQLAKKRTIERKKLLQRAKPNSPARALITFRQPVSAREIFRQLQSQRGSQQKLQFEVKRLRTKSVQETK